MIKAVTPIICPNINWQALNASTKKHMDKYASDPADKAGFTLEKPCAFLEFLHAFTLSKAPRYRVSILHHLSYSFLVVADSLCVCDIISNTELKATFFDSEHCVVSGNLYQWRDAIIIASEHTDVNINNFAKLMVNLFRTVGLALIFPPNIRAYAEN